MPSSTRPTDPIPMVEYEAARERGVALLAYHPWGAVLAPLDERCRGSGSGAARSRRSSADEPGGTVTVATRGSGRGATGSCCRGSGPDARLHGDRFSRFAVPRDEDAGRLVGLLIPDAAYAARQEAAAALVDGRPARPADLPTAWADIEAGVLVEPTFAASYAALAAKAGDLADERAIALAPVSPGGDEAKSWFFVPLPGNLVALELVSEGAHATYCFRVPSRADVRRRPACRRRPSLRPCATSRRRWSTAGSCASRWPLPDDQLRQPRVPALPAGAAGAAVAGCGPRAVRRPDRPSRRRVVGGGAGRPDRLAHAAARRRGVWPGRARPGGDGPDAGAADRPTVRAWSRRIGAS